MASEITRRRVQELLRVSQRLLSRKDIVGILGIGPGAAWSALVDLMLRGEARVAGWLPKGGRGQHEHLYDKNGHLPQAPRPLAKTPVQLHRDYMLRMRYEQPERYAAFREKERRRARERRAEQRAAREPRPVKRRPPREPRTVTPAVHGALTPHQQFVLGALELAGLTPKSVKELAARAGVHYTLTFYAVKELAAADPPICRVADWRYPARGGQPFPVYDLQTHLPPCPRPAPKRPSRAKVGGAPPPDIETFWRKTA